MSADSERTAWWEASGIPFRELIDKLVELALGQHAGRARTKYQIKLPAGSGGALEGQLRAKSEFVAQVKLHHARLGQQAGVGTEGTLRLRQ
jgi:hypothetical protein